MGGNGKIQHGAPMESRSFPLQKLRDIEAVIVLVRELSTTDRSNCGNDVQMAAPLIDGPSGWNCAAPASEEGNSFAALEGSGFASAKRTGISLEPGSMIAGEDQQCVSIQAISSHSS